jgi:hypothetical protein
MQQHSPMAPVKTVHIDDQCAVLIGGFADKDAAFSALKKVKSLKPPEVNLGPNIVPYDLQVRPDPEHHGEYNYDKKENRLVTALDHHGDMKLVGLNPFANSVVVPNPTVPVQQDRNLGEFLKELKNLNEDEEFSLLQNRAPWTLLVQNYTGSMAFVSATTSPIAMMGGHADSGPKQRNVLQASAKQAHEIAGALRQLGLEAYVLHTRESSAVTVGGFSGPNDARMLELADRLAKKKLVIPRNGAEVQVDLEPLHLMQPMMAMEVPGSK